MDYRATMSKGDDSGGEISLAIECTVVAEDPREEESRKDEKIDIARKVDKARSCSLNAGYAASVSIPFLFQ